MAAKSGTTFAQAGWCVPVENLHELAASRDTFSKKSVFDVNFKIYIQRIVRWQFMV